MKYLAAISGGPDSIYLLTKYKKKIKCVCHVNYNKRDNSIKDYLIVKEFCDKNKIHLFYLNVTKLIYEQYKKLGNNFQNKARHIRYDFFCKCANECGTNKLLVAHNKNDFLETAIMQEKKKSKTLFYGILEKSKYKNLFIYRPILNIWKKDILKYLYKKNIPYAIDETNDSNIYERNIVRKHIMEMDKKQLIQTYNHFLKLNKQNSSQIKKVNKLFSKWERIDFSTIFYKNKIQECLRDFIIYKLLTSLDITNISINKIRLVNNFILKNNQNKKLRLGDGNFLININQHIIKI